MNYDRIIIDLAKGQMGLTQAVFTALLSIEGLSSASFVRLKNPEKRLSAANEDELLKLVHVSRSWAYRDDGEQWTPAMRQARAAMQTWAKRAPSENKSQRLIAAWGKLRELVPDFQERIWCGYCRLIAGARVKQKDSPTAQYLASDKAWTLILQGEQLPTDEQLLGAAHLTGIPFSWFKDGDTSEIA